MATKAKHFMQMTSHYDRSEWQRIGCTERPPLHGTHCPTELWQSAIFLYSDALAVCRMYVVISEPKSEPFPVHK